MWDEIKTFSWAMFRTVCNPLRSKKAVLQFTLAALESAATGKEVRPDEVG